MKQVKGMKNGGGGEPLRSWSLRRILKEWEIRPQVFWGNRAFHAEGTASGSQMGEHLLCSVKEELGTGVVGVQYARGRDTPPTPACTEVGYCGQVWLSGLPDTGSILINLFPSYPKGGLKQHWRKQKRSKSHLVEKVAGIILGWRIGGGWTRQAWNIWDHLGTEPHGGWWEWGSGSPFVRHVAKPRLRQTSNIPLQQSLLQASPLLTKIIFI